MRFGRGLEGQVEWKSVRRPADRTSEEKMIGRSSEGEGDVIA